MLTDFGFSGPYIGAMKGVILNINPKVQIVDISHEIRPQNIDEAAFVLNETYHTYPKKTIHMVVVDPGVGSQREILVVKTDTYIFLAPDNGVLKYIFNAYPQSKVYRVFNKHYFRKPVSLTFHGRDIFSPLAAYLSKKTPIDRFGEETDQYIRGEIIKPVLTENRIIGEIIYFDRFGNAVTNIERTILKENTLFWIRIKDRVIDNLSTAYTETDKEKILAIIGSHNNIEIAANHGNVQSILGLKIGDPVVLEWRNE